MCTGKECVRLYTTPDVGPKLTLASVRWATNALDLQRLQNAAAARAGETSARSGQTEAQLNSTDCGFNGLLLRKA
jgi:hypothetical protein